MTARPTTTRPTISSAAVAAAVPAPAPPAMPTSRFSALLLGQPGPRRDTLAACLAAQGAADLAVAATAAATRARIGAESPRDLVVIDGGLPDGPVLPLLADLRRSGWRRTVLLTPRHDAQAVRAALAGGVRGYVVAQPQSEAAAPSSRTFPGPRPLGHGTEARERVGLEGLSRREIEVLSLVSEGMSNKDVGERLGLSALTVKSHLARIARKLGTGDRAHMVAMIMRAGLIR